MAEKNKGNGGDEIRKVKGKGLLQPVEEELRQMIVKTVKKIVRHCGNIVTEIIKVCSNLPKLPYLLGL